MYFNEFIILCMERLSWSPPSLYHSKISRTKHMGRRYFAVIIVLKYKKILLNESDT